MNAKRERSAVLLEAMLDFLFDARYNEYLKKIWPAIRNRTLSRDGDGNPIGLEEPPTPEVARYMWPALVQSFRKTAANQISDMQS